MLSSFAKWVEGIKNEIVDEVKKYKNKDFLEAAIAGCVLVAAADGKIDSSETSKMMGFIKKNKALEVFDAKDILKIYKYFSEILMDDFGIGQGECLAVIGKYKNKPEAQLIVRVCCAIGAADGNFDDDEKNVVRSICKELGLDPSSFQL